MVAGKNKYTLGLVGVLLLFTLICLPTMGRVSLWEIDEGRYLVPAKNAIEHGKWLIPEYNGGPRIQKPPLMVWLVALSSIAVNRGKVNEFSARLPSFLAAMGTILILFLLVKHDAEDEELALTSAFLLSCSYLFVKHARFAITDMVLLFFITLTIALGFAALKNNRCWMWPLSFTAAALGFLTKGPVGIVIPFLVITLWSISTRRHLNGRDAKAILAGTAIMLLIILSWPLAAGPEFWREFILKSNLERALHNPSWKTNTFFYVLNFPSHFILPSVLIPATAYVIKRYSRSAIALYIIWFTAVFVLFSIADTKRSSYILPLYPAASVIAAYGSPKAKETILGLCKRIALLIAAALTLAIQWILMKHSAPISWHLLFLAATSLLIAIPILFKDARKAILIACALFALGYTNLYQPAMDRLYHSPRYCISRMKRFVKDSPLYIYGSLRANEYWYWGKRVIPKVEQALNPPYYFYTRKRRVKLYGTYKRIMCCNYQKEKLCLYKVE